MAVWQGPRRWVVIGNPNAGDGIETVWHLDRADNPRSRTLSFTPLQSTARIFSGRQPVIHARTFRKLMLCVAVLGISICEDDAVNDRNAQGAVTHGRRGVRLKSTKVVC